jgi:NAD(P)-dependent dehydrogenase (short-subunit alcohol dehydrogenase family)
VSKLNEGRVAIVTGAGRGIGREHALALAASGAKVVVNDLGADMDGGGGDATPAQETVNDIIAMGGEAVVNGGNVASFDDAGAMVAQAIDTFGGLDIVINNAGILRDRMLFSMTESDWDAVIAVHLKGTFGPSHHASKYWRERAKAGETNDARIINTSSPSGIYGNIGQTNYGAAKAGIAAFSMIAAMELVRYGVTVNCIAPAALTRMTENLPGLLGSEDAENSMGPRWIANVATWLASPAAAGVTGRVFDVVGDRIGIAESWSLGPTATQGDTPESIGDLMPELMANASLNSDMSGRPTEGPGRPSKTI